MTLADEAECRVAPIARLEALGVTRSQRRAQVAAGRWRAIPGRATALEPGPLSGPDLLTELLVRVGPSAALGGMSALVQHGLLGYEEDTVDIWVPKSQQKGRPAGVRLHETRLWTPADVGPIGLRRSTPPVATVQAALWARTPRQSLLCLVMPIQQRLVRPTDVSMALRRVRRHAFRRMLVAALADIAGGAQSLGELDFAGMCARRGLPEPSRQAVRTDGRGRMYLDVLWREFRVAAEINGAGHARLEQSLRDEVRAIELQASGLASVAVSVLTLRCDAEPFFAALARLLISRGWSGPARPLAS